MKTVLENKSRAQSIFSKRKFHLQIQAVNIMDDEERFTVNYVFGDFNQLWSNLMSFLNDFRQWLSEM